MLYKSLIRAYHPAVIRVLSIAAAVAGEKYKEMLINPTASIITITILLRECRSFLRPRMLVIISMTL
jgi:hypothetical protein